MTFPLPVLHDPLHVQIPQVFSLCNAISISLLLYQNSGLVCFLLILLPAIEVLVKCYLARPDLLDQLLLDPDLTLLMDRSSFIW
jgi:hypothetical protein